MMDYQYRYQYQGQQMAADALVKAANSAPGSQMQVGYGYLPSNNGVSAQEFANWLNYVNSILDISYNHTRMNIIMQTKIIVSQIASQREPSYTQLIDQIKRLLLNLAHNIMQYS